MWVLATIHHAVATDELLDLVCGDFARFLHHPDAQQRPKAPEVGNVMWALAEIQHSLKDGRRLDGLCVYMSNLLQREDHRARPKAQDIAMALWALSQIEHAPPDEVGFAMLEYVVALCQSSGLHVTAEDISNAFASCAELRLSMPFARVKSTSC